MLKSLSDMPVSFSEVVYAFKGDLRLSLTMVHLSEQLKQETEDDHVVEDFEVFGDSVSGRLNHTQTV